MRVTDPPILNIPLDTLIFPEVNANEPTANVPESKVTVPVLKCVNAPETVNVPVLNSIVPVPLVNVPVLVRVNELKFRVEFAVTVNVVFTSKFDPKLTFDV